MTATFRLGDHVVGSGEPPLIIAELSGNHNGRLDRALAIVDAVALTGAQALKIQTYRADTLTIDVDAPAFRISDQHGLWSGRSLYDLYREAATPWEWHEPIFERARQRGLIAFSTPFDETAVDLLEQLGAPLYKIASAELVDLPLVARVARTGKPVILSTGMATLAEIDAAVTTARANGAQHVVVLVCTSSYPADPEDAHLGSLPVLRDSFDVIVGLSDHTRGVGVSVAAVALGASVIEKHVTLDRLAGGVDSEFSLDPEELSLLVRECSAAHAAASPARFGPRDSEREVLRLRRSLFVVEDVAEGEPVTAVNVRSIRPSGGLPPGDLQLVIGRTFRRAAPRGTPLTWDLL
jgi:N-acetylneuraminate synthase